jgi:hypothetical protein
MFRLITFTLKMALRLRLLLLAFAAGMGVAYLQQLWSQHGSWGLLPGGDERGLAGDGLVAAPDISETRALEIEAPADAVWPWLLQLGYGRGGWYSFAPLDRAWSPAGGSPGRSAEVILEEFQELAEGDVVPTSSGGGLVVRELQPGRALVLYLDDVLAREQLEAWAAEAADEAAAAKADIDMPPYAVSWAFVLEDVPGGRTRLIERLRFRTDVRNQAPRRAMPLLGLAAFALMRSQMLGIKRRAEGVGSGRA